MKKNPTVFSKLRGRFRSHLIRNLILFLVILALAGLGIPQILSLHDQSRAGGLLDAFLQREASDYQDHFACLIPILEDLPVSDDEVGQAIDLLQRAARLAPNQTHVEYLLGKAYCLAQDYENAVEALSEYSVRRPDDPLGLMEQAFAYFTWAQTLGEDQADEYARLMDLSMSTLEAAGITGPLLIQHADNAYQDGNYKTAWIWYSLAGNSQELSDLKLFRKSVLDILFNRNRNDLTASLNGVWIDINPDENSFISPLSFFHIEDGTSVPTREINGQTTGILYRNKETGGAFIFISTSGCYHFVLHALDRPPAGTQLEFSIDFQPVMTLELPNGDDAWITFSEEIQLEEGKHLIGFQLINDGKIDGVDRNAHFGSVELQKCNTN